MSVNGRTITYINSSLSLTGDDEDVYFGHCVLKGDKVFFICTTTLGSTYLAVFDLSQQDLSEEKITLLMKTSVNNTLFVQHQLYYDENIAVYNNGSSTMFYNISCQNSVATVDHQHQLSLVIPSDGQYLCTCRILKPAESVVTFSPGNNNIPVGIIVGVIMPVVVIIIIAVTLLFVGVWKKKQLTR